MAHIRNTFILYDFIRFYGFPKNKKTTECISLINLSQVMDLAPRSELD